VIFLFRVFRPPATLPIGVAGGSKMTMMKKKMAMDLVSATATTEQTRDEDGEYEDGTYARRYRLPGLEFQPQSYRFQIIATQCPIYRRTQESKEKAKVKKRGLATLQRRESAKAIFRQPCIHDQVTDRLRTPINTHHYYAHQSYKH
jgi:hypothetical protein